METIVDIYGHSANFDEMYELENSWYGSVLVREDQTFEGVVSDYYGEAFSYVCGKMAKDELSVYKCPTEDKQMPHHYYAEREGNKFYGILAATNLFADVPIGECKMSLLPADKTREETDLERENIKARIKLVKSALGPNGLQLAEQFANDREKLNADTK